MVIFDNFISILAFVIRQKRIPRLYSPKSLTDKILNVKLNTKSQLSELRKLSADRLGVRDYISSKSSACRLIDILWSGVELCPDVWNSLPNKFVIKANHGSKMVMIVDKNKHSYEDVQRISKGWLSNDYYKKGKEWVYKDTTRKLLVEKFMNFSGDVPPDYKFFCLNGKVGFVQVDLDRFESHKRNIYTSDFRLLDVEYHFSQGNNIEKPRNFEAAIEIAEQLSAEFDFIRVDLYILPKGIYFGELTNFPGNCLEKFSDYSFDLDMGSKLVLNND